MSALKDEDLKALARRLEEREEELRAEVRGAREEAEAAREVGSGDVADTGDAGEAKTRSDIGHAEMERDLEELMDIEAAKQRLADGSYGRCVDCGVNIDHARLRVQPTACRCTECQQRFERLHPAPGNAART